MCISEPDQVIGVVLVCVLDDFIQSTGCKSQIPDRVLFILVREEELLEDNQVPNRVSDCIEPLEGGI